MTAHQTKNYLSRLLTVVCGLILLASCSFKDPKYQQYYAQGQSLYEKNCSNCHQKSGKGLGRVYPPLAQSDFLKNNLNESICLMRYGKQGDILVNTIRYNKPMPGVIGLTDFV